MQGLPNRMGLGMRPAQYGQGPSFSALAQQQQQQKQGGGGGGDKLPQQLTTLFVGSIAAGITDAFLNQLLAACGPVRAFKRLLTTQGKPQAFGFAEFEDPDSVLRALQLLNGVELPSVEDGKPKKLLVKADQRVQQFLTAYEAQRGKADIDTIALDDAREKVNQLLESATDNSNDPNSDAANRDKYVIPPHLHDLQEADLPETQRGLVISEIAQFRERAAMKERDKLREARAAIRVAAPQLPASSMRSTPASAGSQASTPGGTLPGWQTRHQAIQHNRGGPPAPSFTREESREPSRHKSTPIEKTDEELERERRDARAREEDNSFRDRERRWERRERDRISAIQRQLDNEQRARDSEERDKQEIQDRLHIWDDDESDETFYTDRVRWRASRTRFSASERETDDRSRAQEATQAEELRMASEAFLAQQMEEMQAMADEQRKAGLLLDDAAPVKLSVSLPTKPAPEPKPAAHAVVLTADDEEEAAVKKRKTLPMKLDFSINDNPEKLREKLQEIRAAVPREREPLFKARVRWDSVNDSVIDRKMEPIIRRKLRQYLGELDDELLMFVIEHLKDQKGPQKLVEGVEPVLVEDTDEFVIALWRQVIFESMSYGEGLHTGDMRVDDD